MPSWATASTSDERGQHERERRAVAEEAVREGLRVDLRRERLGRVVGAATGEGEDLVERPQPEDQRQRRARRDRRREQRQRHAAEAEPCRGAVDRRRLVELFRDPLQPGQVDHHREPGELPDHRDEDRPERPVGIAEPRTLARVQPDRAEQQVERAAVVEDVLPDVGACERAQDNRQEEQRAQHADATSPCG